MPDPEAPDRAGPAGRMARKASPGGMMLKRAFDLVVAPLGLLVLRPVHAAVAVVRLSSPGRYPPMSSSNPIQAELTTLFAEKLGIEVPSSETDLVANDLLDSLGLVKLLVHLEQRFDTRISPEDLELDNFRSVNRIAQFLAARNGSDGHTEA